MIFVVLIPLKIMLLIWLMTQEWFWIAVAWLIGLGVCLAGLVLIVNLLSKL